MDGEKIFGERMDEKMMIREDGQSQIHKSSQPSSSSSKSSRGLTGNHLHAKKRRGASSGNCDGENGEDQVREMDKKGWLWAMPDHAVSKVQEYLGEVTIESDKQALVLFRHVPGGWNVSMPGTCANIKAVLKYLFYYDVNVVRFNWDYSHDDDRGSNKLHDFRYMIKTIGSSSRGSSLKILLLNLKELGFVEVGNLLACCPRLEVLTIGGHHLHEHSLAGLFSGIAKHQSLRVFKIKLAHLNLSHFQALVECRSLEVLELDRCFLDRINEEGNNNSLSPPLPKLGHLRELVVRRMTLIGRGRQKSLLFGMISQMEQGEASRMEKLHVRSLQEEAVFTEDVLTSHPRIKSLSLEGGILTDAHAILIAKYVERTSVLQDLNLRYNKLGDIAGVALGVALEKNSSLLGLDVSGNRMTETSGNAIGKGLIVNTSLRALFAMDCFLSGDAYEPILRAVTYNHQLETLELGGKYSYVMRQSFSHILPLGSLKKLEIMGINTNASLRLINRSIDTTKLSILRLAGNQLTNDAGKALLRGLMTNQTLKKLDVSENMLGDPFCSDLESFLEQNTSMTHLNLSCNQIKSNGAVFLARVLAQRNQILKELLLENNHLGKNAGRAFGKALISNGSLKVLSLDRNQLGSEGVTGFASGLQTNCTLKTLDLSRNGACSTKSFPQETFFDAIATNKGLAVLRLSGNGAGNSFLRKLFKALRQNNTLLHVYLIGNHFRPQDLHKRLLQDLSMEIHFY